MKSRSTIGKIAFIGTYLPRKCGIGTFTHDLCRAVSERYRDAECIAIPVTDTDGGYEYPPEVCFEIAERDVDSYRRAADYLNVSNVDVVCLQHEFGIFGGPAGSHVVGLLRDLRIPSVVTLHTILDELSADQQRVFDEVLALATRLVVMSARGQRLLVDKFQVSPDKIDLIPHGVPDMPFVDPNFYKDQYGAEGKHVLLTFGLLSPSKGIEYVLRALPQLVQQFPDLVYIVLGATHPNLVREQGEVYRLGLMRLAQELGIARHVGFYDRFVELEELLQFIGAADIYLTPYLNPKQITSGTLTYAFGCGKAVISTPYWHAEELLAEGRGCLVPFGDADAIAREVKSLLSSPARLHSMRKNGYLLGREMIWSSAAHRYMGAFVAARHSRSSVQRGSLAIRTLGQWQRQLPTTRLGHLCRMTDSTALMQHAAYVVPRYEEGYCTDDNARALILTVLLEEAGQDSPEVERLATTYAAFLNHAYDSKRRRFRSLMDFNRHWVESADSDDAQGRALWALGTCVGRSLRRGLQCWAVRLFGEAAPALEGTDSPRTWAFALLGIHEYSRRLSGDRNMTTLRNRLTQRLVDAYRQQAGGDWQWFEDRLTYDNAKLAHALVLSGAMDDQEPVLDIGIEALRWLVSVQTSEHGHFRPVGSEGFYRRGGDRAAFDQQPLEAHSTLSACVDAYRVTHQSFWLEQTRLAFDWFLGRNDLGLDLYDPSTGGCRDGLHMDRTNENQGAESTLAFLLSLTELRLLESSLRAFSRPTDIDRRETSYLSPQ